MPAIVTPHAQLPSKIEVAVLDKYSWMMTIFVSMHSELQQLLPEELELAVSLLAGGTPLRLGPTSIPV
jgi:hypothetical protein